MNKPLKSWVENMGGTRLQARQDADSSHSGCLAPR